MVVFFPQSTYYMEGNTGHPVFETQFGKLIYCSRTMLLLLGSEEEESQIKAAVIQS